MGKRREPRKDIKVPVRIFGTDSGGQIFSEKVFTTNVSQHGAEVTGVQAQPNVDEIVDAARKSLHLLAVGDYISYVKLRGYSAGPVERAGLPAEGIAI